MIAEPASRGDRNGREVPLSQEPIPQLRQVFSDPHLEWSYDRLTEVRRTAERLRDSGFLWIHEKTHLSEIIERVDATIGLKHERDEYQAFMRKRRSGKPRSPDSDSGTAQESAHGRGDAL